MYGSTGTFKRSPTKRIHFSKASCIHASFKKSRIATKRVKSIKLGWTLVQEDALPAVNWPKLAYINLSNCAGFSNWIHCSGSSSTLASNGGYCVASASGEPNADRGVDLGKTELEAEDTSWCAKLSPAASVARSRLYWSVRYFIILTWWITATASSFFNARSSSTYPAGSKSSNVEIASLIDATCSFICANS